jgi:hypothetical protein
MLIEYNLLVSKESRLELKVSDLKTIKEIRKEPVYLRIHLIERLKILEYSQFLYNPRRTTYWTPVITKKRWEDGIFGRPLIAKAFF